MAFRDGARCGCNLEDTPGLTLCEVTLQQLLDALQFSRALGHVEVYSEAPPGKTYKVWTKPVVVPTDIGGTLDDCQRWVNATYGAYCSSCGREHKVYARTIYRSLIRWLAALAISKTQPLSVNDLPKVRGGDYAKLVYWGLVRGVREERPETANRSGYWFSRHTAVSFLKGEPTAKYAFVFDGRLLRLSDELTDVHECLGRTFDYQEIIGNPSIVLSDARWDEYAPKRGAARKDNGSTDSAAGLL